MTHELPDFITEASGRLGDRVYLKGKNKVVSRKYVPSPDPRTTSQRLARTRFAQAARAWAVLSDEQRRAWDAYGATRRRTAPTWADTNTQTGYGAFMTLAVKRLHAQPDAGPIVWPPNAPFAGDTLTLTAHAEAGAIAWQASGPNALGIVTELLVQPMRRASSSPSMEKYRTLTFTAFTEQNQKAATPLAPGLWACAVRFTDLATGQTTALAMLPPVWVSA